MCGSVAASRQRLELTSKEPESSGSTSNDTGWRSTQEGRDALKAFNKKKMRELVALIDKAGFVDDEIRKQFSCNLRRWARYHLERGGSRKLWPSDNTSHKRRRDDLNKL